MIQSLKPLLELQEVDLATDRLDERIRRLPERAELADVEQRLSEVRAAISATETEIEGLLREIGKLEGEVQTISDKIEREEHKLYSGQVINPKEVSALQTEVEMLRRRKDPVEENAIEKLVARDDAMAERKRLREEAERLEAEAADVRSRLDGAIRELQTRISEQRERRDGIVGQVPIDVVDLYQSLRESKKGVGAGALEGRVCTGCGEEISAVELDRIRKAARGGETLFRCEHCRRILVVQ